MLKKIFLVLSIVILSLLITAPAQAAQTRFSDTINLTAEQTINENVLAAGGTVSSASKVSRDLIVLAGDATISGDVSQDLTVFGGTIRITGKVGDDLRVLGGTVNISGKIASDVLAVAGTVVVEQGGEIGGDLEVYGGTVQVAGKVDGELRGNTSTAIIAGTINKNVSINSRDIKITKSAELGGDFNYTSDQAATIQSGSIIAGKISHNLPQKVAKSTVAATCFSALAYILLAIVLILLAPKVAREAKEELAQNFWPSLLVGVLSLVVVPTLFLILLLTVIGSPIAVILIILYGILVYIAKILVGFLLGEKIVTLIDKKKEVSMVWSVVFGLVILLILFQIPFVGSIINFVATLFGLGGLALYLKKVYLASRKKSA